MIEKIMHVLVAVVLICHVNSKIEIQAATGRDLSSGVDQFKQKTSELGINALISNSTKKPITSIAVVAVGEHTCALKENSGVKCWVKNTYGQVAGDRCFEKDDPYIKNQLALMKKW